MISLPGKGGQDRTARTGPPGWGYLHRAARIRQTGKIERRGQPEEDS
jgi:hypothetical protein